jgi:Holliday junction resolvase RusA-like endonuclease
MKTIEFVVNMECPTQGSMKAFPFKGKDGRMHVNQVHSHQKEIKDFRKAVADVLGQFVDDFYVDDENVGYVVQIISYGSKGKTVKRKLPTVRGTRDIDKVARAVLDSLTFNPVTKIGAFKDDSQVVKIIATKIYVNEAVPEPITKIRVTKVLMDSQISNEFEEEPELKESF